MKLIYGSIKTVAVSPMLFHKWTLPNQLLKGTQKLKDVYSLQIKNCEEQKTVANSSRTQRMKEIGKPESEWLEKNKGQFLLNVCHVSQSNVSRFSNFEESPEFLVWTHKLPFWYAGTIIFTRYSMSQRQHDMGWIWPMAHQFMTSAGKNDYFLSVGIRQNMGTVWSLRSYWEFSR